jgi:ketosteroid isomerase-like protein
MEPRARASQPVAMTTATTPEETHAVIAAAFNAGDLEAFVGAYEPDAVVLTPPAGRPAGIPVRPG